MLKSQLFKDNRSDKIKLRGSKHQHLDLRDNKEEEDLDKFEGENKGEGIRYVLFFFVALL